MENLTDAEISALRRLVPHVAEIEADAEYNKSRAVMVKHWKAFTIGVAATLTATLLLLDRVREFVVWLSK